MQYNLEHQGATLEHMQSKTKILCKMQCNVEEGATQILCKMQRNAEEGARLVHNDVNCTGSLIDILLKYLAGHLMRLQFQ